MEVSVFNDPAELAKQAAGYIAERIQRGHVRNLGLAGGSTPMATYEALAGESVDWTRVRLWLGDERWVPNDSEDSNGRMAREILAGPTGAELLEISYSQSGDPQAAAQGYESGLDRLFSESTGRPDLVLLGLGDDGHTASLFSQSSALLEKERRYVATWVPKLDAWRLTATVPLLQTVSQLVFLVTGERKAEAVRWITRPSPDDPIVPARQVVEAATNVLLLLDRAAATEIDPRL